MYYMNVCFSDRKMVQVFQSEVYKPVLVILIPSSMRTFFYIYTRYFLITFCYLKLFGRDSSRTSCVILHILENFLLEM